MCDGVSLLDVTHDEAAQALKRAMDMESVSYSHIHVHVCSGYYTRIHTNVKIHNLQRKYPWSLSRLVVYAMLGMKLV